MTGIFAAVHAAKPNSAHVTSSHKQTLSEVIEYESISAEQTC